MKKIVSISTLAGPGGVIRIFGLDSDGTLYWRPDPAEGKPGLWVEVPTVFAAPQPPNKKTKQ